MPNSISSSPVSPLFGFSSVYAFISFDRPVFPIVVVLLLLLLLLLEMKALKLWHFLLHYLFFPILIILWISINWNVKNLTFCFTIFIARKLYKRSVLLFSEKVSKLVIWKLLYFPHTLWTFLHFPKILFFNPIMARFTVSIQWPVILTRYFFKLKCTQ